MKLILFGIINSLLILSFFFYIYMTTDRTIINSIFKNTKIIFDNKTNSYHVFGDVIIVSDQDFQQFKLLPESQFIEPFDYFSDNPPNIIQIDTYVNSYEFLPQETDTKFITLYSSYYNPKYHLIVDSDKLKLDFNLLILLSFILLLQIYIYRFF